MISTATEAERKALFKSSQRSGDESTRNRPKIERIVDGRLDFGPHKERRKASNGWPAVDATAKPSHRRMIRLDGGGWRRRG